MNFAARILALSIGTVGCAAAKPTPLVAAESLLTRERVGVRWGRSLVVEVTLDGVPDVVSLGTTNSTVVVGIVEGPARSSSRLWVFDFPIDPDAQMGVCGSPSDAVIAVEDLALPLDAFGCGSAEKSDYCIAVGALAARLSVAAGHGSKGIRVESGDCDAIHLYYDGTKVTWWRR